MGDGEAAPPTKPAKASSPVKEQPIVHQYPDWTAIQAYYGPGVTVPPPYLTASVASGHAPPPYMWGPQPFMPPPYGTPYAAIYPGAYAHPSVPLGSHLQGQGVVPSPNTNESVVMATPLSVELPGKSPGSKGGGLLKKLKGIDGLPLSNGDGKDENTSPESGAEGSSDGSDANDETGDRRIRGRGSSEDYPISSSPTPGKKIRVSADGEVKGSAAPPPPPPKLSYAERALRREKRKMSNRESARRSRLRKQAETEGLALKVETLGAENMTLKTEIMRLKENSETLRLENSALMEKLKNAGHGVEMCEEVGPLGVPSVSTENLLSPRVNNPNSCSSSGNPEADSAEISSRKVHRLLGSGSRTDALAAS